METKREKVYVAIGPELLDGFSTLQWTFRRWSCHEISSIVILYAPDNMSGDYVYTPLGKLPVSSVSEEKLKALEKFEEAKKDKILSLYMNFCCKVKVEYRKMEKTDQPLHSRIVEMISTLKITRLVMSLAFMKTSSGKSRPAISGSYYVVRQKPDFCQLFVISGGRLVFLREDKDEGIIEDDKGFMVARFKERNRSIRNWLGRMFVEDAGCSSPDSPSSSRINSLNNQWERYSAEIQQYVNQMLSLHAQEEGQISVNNCSELNMPENKDAHERIRILKRRIQDAQDAVQLNRNEANAAGERSEKAQWIINICNNRAEELEACINEEVMKHVDLKQQLGQRRHELHELEIEVNKSRSKLNSITQLQKEISDKLQLSTCAKSQAEIQLENAVKTQADMVQDIEKLRNQRDVLQRRTEFCHEKDAIEAESKLTELGFGFREFSAAQVRAATDDFSPRHRLKSGSNWTNVYRGQISHMTVAIKMHDPFNAQCHEAFDVKVKFVSQARHPNLLPVIGFCSEINCIVYEFMHNGSLQDVLLSTEGSSTRTRQSLSWHNRMRIAAEICSALGFLHKAKPKPIIHGNLSLLKILLDRNNVAKLNGLNSPWLSDDESYDVRLDICTFGNFLVQLLTGKNWDLDMDSDTVMGRLDQSAGKWPLDLAMELCSIALRCLSCKNEEEPVNDMPMKDINDLKEKADQLILNTTSVNCCEIIVQDFNSAPGAFICPIYQDVMLDPHVAADGFSYELEAISAWLRTGRDTSPMTNLRLSHKFLTPNHTLRSLIQDWQNKSSAVLPN